MSVTVRGCFVLLAEVLEQKVELLLRRPAVPRLRFPDEVVLLQHRHGRGYRRHRHVRHVPAERRVRQRAAQARNVLHHCRRLRRLALRVWSSFAPAAMVDDVGRLEFRRDLRAERRALQAAKRIHMRAADRLDRIHLDDVALDQVGDGRLHALALTLRLHVELQRGQR
jgi:hypothetical protein